MKRVIFQFVVCYKCGVMAADLISASIVITLAQQSTSFVCVSLNILLKQNSRCLVAIVFLERGDEVRVECVAGYFYRRRI